MPARTGGARRLADLKFGVLKWFNARKGFGFVTPAEGGPDLFVHIAAVEGTDEKPAAMVDGARVAYVVGGEKGGRVMVTSVRVIPT